VKREEGREKGKKKIVRLKIQVEKAELQNDKLRVKGKITECPEEVEKGSYHTIEVGIGTKLEIEKSSWTEEDIKRLRKAERVMKSAGSELINEFIMHVNRNDGLAAYGMDQVKTAASYGAAKVVLIPRNNINEKVIEELISDTEKKGGEIVLVSDRNRLGKEFCKMYGIGAILRFAIS
jgi:stalled ribosome rescue protein Dom34